MYVSPPFTFNLLDLLFLEFDLLRELHFQSYSSYIFLENKTPRTIIFCEGVPVFTCADPSFDHSLGWLYVVVFSVLFTDKACRPKRIRLLSKQFISAMLTLYNHFFILFRA